MNETPSPSNTAQAALIQLGVLALQSLLREAPAAIAGIRELLAKDDPTDADYEVARAKIAADTYASLVPEAAKFPVQPPA